MYQHHKVHMIYSQTKESHNKYTNKTTFLGNFHVTLQFIKNPNVDVFNIALK